MSKEIILTQGKRAIVDDEDYDFLSQYSWYVAYQKGWYAARRGLGHTTIKMHLELIQAPFDMLIDHKDGNGLNNQKDNLRVATHAQNCQNRNKLANCSSDFKGVFWRQDIKKWQSYIYIKRAKKILGNFTTEIEAAIYYDIAAKIYFGEFAKLNFPELTINEENDNESYDDGNQ